MCLLSLPPSNRHRLLGHWLQSFRNKPLLILSPLLLPLLPLCPFRLQASLQVLVGPVSPQQERNLPQPLLPLLQ